MKIVVGSKNPAKVEAVREILQDYPHLKDAEVVGVDVSSGVSDQPKSLEETLTGATNRARSVFTDCDYSVGIESGVMPVPLTKSGYMDLTTCAIYDGSEFHLGLSSAWEFPDKEVMRSVVEDGLDLNQAVHKAGMTTDANIGSSNGAISLVTKGRLDRKAYTKQALQMALIHIDLPAQAGAQ
jgi:inosine/xanthosine triphosphatase